MGILLKINALIKSLRTINKLGADKVYNLTKNDNIFEEIHQEDIDEELDEFDLEKDLEDEYLRTLLPEYSDDKNKIYEDIKIPKETLIYIFDILNFHVIQKESGDYLGMGAEGIVFAGIYKGKDAVIKIQYEPFYSDNAEILNWKNMLALKRKLPEDLKQYIPEIMFLDIVTSGKYKFPVIIMERLYPIDPGNYFMGDSENYKNKKQIYDNRNSTELLFELSKLLENVLNSDKLKIFDYMYNHKIPKELFSLENISFVRYRDSIFINYFGNMIKYLKPDIKKNILEKDPHLSLIIYESFKKIFLKTYNSRGEYNTFEYFEKNDLRAPGHNQFIKFINILKSYGIIIKDLHYNNLMENKDHVPKIIDISLFYVPSVFNDEDDSYL